MAEWLVTVLKPEGNAPDDVEPGSIIENDRDYTLDNIQVLPRWLHAKKTLEIDAALVRRRNGQFQAA